MAKGIYLRKLVLICIRAILPNTTRRQSKKVKFPLIKSKDPKVNMTNEQIYEHVEFP
jgi:hypothetical protein